MLLHAKGSLAEKPDPAGGSGLSDDDVLADDQDIVPVDEVAMDEVPESNDGVVVEEDEEDNMVLAGAALRGGGNNKKTDFGLDKVRRRPRNYQSRTTVHA